VDLQLESGEYFLKPGEKEAREQARRKKEVSAPPNVAPKKRLSPFLHSKKRCLLRDKLNEQKHLSHRMRILLRSERRVGASGKGKIERIGLFWRSIVFVV
jgi:hypothetical protein